jgi:hypothetical protein
VVTLIQRLRSAGNLNIHLRCLVLNGPVRLSHTRLFERVFDFDPERRPNCDGPLKIIAAILDQSVIENILTPLDLQAPASDCFEAKTSW